MTLSGRDGDMLSVLLITTLEFKNFSDKNEKCNLFKARKCVNMMNHEDITAYQSCTGIIAGINVVLQVLEMLCGGAGSTV